MWGLFRLAAGFLPSLPAWAWRALGVIVVVAAVAGAGWWIYGAGHRAGVAMEQSKQAEAIRLAKEAATATEQKRQEGVNHALQKQIDDLQSINAGLSGDIERLRQRKTRASLPENSRADCQGATGAELSGEDAAFLVREAARADTLRAALAACYAYADSLTAD